MRSEKVTVSVPHRLLEAFEKHSAELGYANVLEFLLWTGFYSLMVQRPHTITAPIAGFPMDMQDEVIEKVVGAYEHGQPLRGSYLEAVLMDAAKRLGITLPKDVLQALVSDTVRNRPRSSGA